MLKAQYVKHNLLFKRAGGTSRGVLTEKETWYIFLEDGDHWGIGEVGLFRGLSAEDQPDFEQQLRKSCQLIEKGLDSLLAYNAQFPSIQFGLEQAFRSLKSEDPFVHFNSSFCQKEEPIPINGLIWMGGAEFMKEQIEEKLAQGFTCLKLKIGALDFDQELSILREIRTRFTQEELEIRVDANGAFSSETALEKLKQLSELQLHSIEQPIKAGQESRMANICEKSALPIALDEELIGVFEVEQKRELLDKIQPDYIILKPSLIGGWSGSDQWIQLAEERGIGWWITSALESNIGLNAIAQYTFHKKVDIPQGLGTGGLFTNNWTSPLEVSEGNLYYRKGLSWNKDLKQYLCM